VRAKTEWIWWEVYFEYDGGHGIYTLPAADQDAALRDASDSLKERAGLFIYAVGRKNGALTHYVK
jgi:1,2-phenylacetyl-CoA epoxidase PaaB subunit